MNHQVLSIMARLQAKGIVPTADGESIVASTFERVLGPDALAELRTDAADVLALLAALTPSLVIRAKCVEAAQFARVRGQNRKRNHHALLVRRGRRESF